MSVNKKMIEMFRASSAYINAHRNKVFVVSLGGEAQADNNLANIVYDLSLLHSLGVKIVLIHGSRPQITEALAAQGKQSNYHRNIRVTEPDCIETIKQVVGGLSVDLEALFSMGISNSPMHGANIHLCRGNFIIAKPFGVHDGIDFHHTGAVRKVQSLAIKKELDNNNILMLSNLGYSLTGEVFNLSAEEVATEVAIALGADKLILMIPADGVLDESGKLVTSLNEEEAKNHASKLSLSGDPEELCVSHAIDAALHACSHNVHRSHLISFKQNGALLQELFTRNGSGSLISNDNFDQLRPASINDVAGILALIKPLEEAGILVERSRELLEMEIKNFVIIELENSIIACAALYPISKDTGEVACIAIHPDYQKDGLGDRLLINLEKTASKKGFSFLFVLTTVASHWFLEKGFEQIEVGALPDQRKNLYNLQRKSKVLKKAIS